MYSQLFLVIFCHKWYFTIFVAEYNSNTINSTDGVQIDLLIIRDDNVINLCEIKFSGDVYQIDKDEELKLRRRIATLKEHISPKQTIHLTMITTYGITTGKHSDIVQKQITMDNLFAV